MAESSYRSPGMRVAAAAARIAIAIALVMLAAWSELALWFQAPFQPTGRVALAALFATVFLAAALSLIARKAMMWTLPAAAALAILLAFWWSSITPRDDRAWMPEVSRNAVLAINGDDLEVRNVRSFRWTGAEDADPHWETRLYSLSGLTGLDLFTSHWGSENIAHAVLSFTFAQGPPLALSLEIRKERGEDYSPLAGFFKVYELALVAADESDVIKVRTNLRNETVRRYPIDARPENIRKLLIAYADLSQSLAQQPRFYHTIWTNCTTQVHAMLRKISPADFPFDIRILLSGRVPDYLYRIGFLDRSQPFEELRRRADITLRAKLAESDADFSTAIRR